METLSKTHLSLEASGAGGGSGGGGCGGGGGDHGGSRLSDASVGVVLEGDDDEVVEGGRGSCVSEFSVVDLESGGGGGGVHGGECVKVHLSSVERDCRICHMSLDISSQECENGVPIELGCSCKDDLAAAHKHCAEAWFKIKGNKTCEICGSIAHNVAGVHEAELMEQWNEANDAMSSATAPGGTTTAASDNRSFWQGHRFLNFLLACMVFAFVISWLFHFNVPS
ncbi:putative Zinc finger, RING-CH-type, Zinc finger, RING/FYVE/PHD-type [Helianthus annuus]|nr:putative Zinc finger, RING-CH-type, Zinc finger, RING/FYVE/PHD-type [Helianthus annuus]